MRPVLVVPPAELPVTLAEAKEQCRVDGDHEDGLILDLVRAAVAHLDGYGGILRRCLVRQTWEIAAPGWWTTLRLPFPDVLDAEIRWDGPLGTSGTVVASDLVQGEDGSGLWLGFARGWVRPALPTTIPLPVRARVTFGYGDATDVPHSLRQAIKIHVSAMYHGREGEVGPGSVYDALIAPHRAVRV